MIAVIARTQPGEKATCQPSKPLKRHWEYTMKTKFRKALGLRGLAPHSRAASPVADGKGKRFAPAVACSLLALTMAAPGIGI